jgi:hypothetical protein
MTIELSFNLTTARFRRDAGRRAPEARPKTVKRAKKGPDA